MRSADTSSRTTPRRSVPDACEPAPPGTSLDDGRYRLDTVCGRTISTIRYRAHDERLDRPVVFEEYVPTGAVRRGRRILVAPRLRERFEADRRRFEERGRAIARIARPGTVRIYGVLREGGTSGLVSEFVDGTTLRRLRAERGGPLPDEAVRDVAARVAAALRPAHAASVFHGALDLDAIVLTDEGRLVVTDFDLAGSAGDDPTPRIRADIAALAEVLRAVGDIGIDPPPEGRGWSGFDELLADLGVVGLPRNPISPLIELRAGPAVGEPAAAPGGGELTTTPIVTGVPSAPEPIVPVRPNPVARTTTETDTTLHDAPTDSGDPDATTVWGADGIRAGETGFGPHPPTRSISVVPFVIATFALCSAAPVLGGAAFVLVVLPVLATLGDPRRNGLRRFATIRFLGHQVRGLVRALPVIGLAVLLLLGHRAAVGADLGPVATDLLLRITGVAVAAGLLGALRASTERSSLRAGLRRVMTRSETELGIGERTITIWIVLLALTVIAIWVDPTPFPVP